MDELINYDTERIIFVKPTQVGGTEALQNMLGYVIQQDPSPTMIVYPTDILAKSISENRLEPMIMATRTLKSLYNKTNHRSWSCSLMECTCRWPDPTRHRPWRRRRSSTCSWMRWINTQDHPRKSRIQSHWRWREPRPSETGRST